MWSGSAFSFFFCGVTDVIIGAEVIGGAAATMSGGGSFESVAFSSRTSLNSICVIAANFYAGLVRTSLGTRLVEGPC